MKPCVVARLTALTPEDLPRVRELALLSGSGFDPAAELERSWARVWVARASESTPPLGIALAWRAADEVHLLDLAVDPQIRREGYARRLLAALIEAERAEGAAVVLLEVRASNAPALSLYRSTGFSESSVRRAYYSDDGEDAIVMRRELCAIGTPA